MRWAAATLLLTCLTVRGLAQENYLPNAAQPLSPSEQAQVLFVRIDGRQFLLPLHAETRGTWKAGVQHRTVVEFSNYHQFSRGVTITPVN